MTIELLQNDYRELFREASESTEPSHCSDGFDKICQFPKQLGQGYSRVIRLREGLELAIDDYQLRDRLITKAPDREHSLEYTFYISGGHQEKQTAASAGQYAVCGSGMAPGETYEFSSQRIHFVNVHIEPELFSQWTSNLESIAPAQRQLIRSPDRTYDTHLGTTTAIMQTALHQILHCPYQGLTKQVYLESKVWELMALLLDQIGDSSDRTRKLKPEDVERIHYAGEVLLTRLENPPSLMELARIVGINDHKLKIGFRYCFGTTVFGYLHERRMERSRQLLEAGEFTVTQAAQAVGFANRGYFAASFRRKFGVNPSAYRKTPSSDRCHRQFHTFFR